MNTENNKKVLDLIYSSITSESGDGDAIWLSKHTSLDEIIILINEYNIKNNIDWTVKKEKNYINWGTDQEWATITCDESFFNSQPDWIILRINY
tara:strand:+ start:1146 stop:1427 length:282 start_codon:yes stop_codon:yes gene_type:complete